MAGEPDLTPGQSSEWVLHLQRVLNHHYQQTVVAESGEFDDTTENAVRHFRQQNGLPDSSTVDAAVWSQLAGHTAAAGSGDATPAQHHTEAGSTQHHSAQQGAHQAEHAGHQMAADPVAGVHEGDPADAGAPLDQPGLDDPAEGFDTNAAATSWPDATSVKVWVKAFIPGSYHGNIDGTGAASGRRLLPGPSSWFNDCFHTDDRDFSNDITAPSRLHSEFELDLRSGHLSEVHFCGETVEYDCEDGDEECRDTATGQMAWTNLRQHNGDILVDLSGAAGNPCFSGAPEIDYEGTVVIDVSAHTITFNGLVNGFPAYEGYATINGGAGEVLFQYGPRGGPSDLAGSAGDPVFGSASF